MSEKINSELNAEETLDTASEDAEKAGIAAEDNATVADNTVSDAETPDTEKTEDEAKPAKKKPFLQPPIIIACCIVLAAILGFLVYIAFFLKEPENVTWSDEINGTKVYLEFKSDGTYTGYFGSVELIGSFQKTKDDEGKNSIAIDQNFGNFIQGMPATYTITGSKILGNQKMTCSYGEDREFTMTQAKRDKSPLELPEDFTPDDNLTGSWVVKYMNYDVIKATFNKDGSMVLEMNQGATVKYNGIYTIDGSTINFTYYLTDSTVVPLNYTIDGDYMNFMGYNFVRVGSDAEKSTADQQSLTAQANEQAQTNEQAQANEQTQETQAAEAVTEAAE